MRGDESTVKRSGYLGPIDALVGRELRGASLAAEQPSGDKG